MQIIATVNIEVFFSLKWALYKPKNQRLRHISMCMLLKKMTVIAVVKLFKAATNLNVYAFEKKGKAHLKDKFLGRYVSVL